MAKRNGLIILRVKNNLYQKELAERLGVSVSLISRIESGDRKGNFKFWNKLQKEFGLTDREIEKLKKN